jgi:hypothetical protein
MDTPEQAELRAAAIQAAERGGWRKLARQVGMSPAGVKRALLGERLQEVTWTKLREWYAREVLERKDPPLESGAVLLEALLRQVAPTLREQIRTAVIEDVGRIYGDAKMPAPAWLLEVPGGLESYEAGVRDRREPFAVVELLGGERFQVNEQPFAGDPRSVVEEIASGRGVWRENVYHPAHRVHRITYGEESPRAG